MSKITVYNCDRCKKEFHTPHVVAGTMTDNTGIHAPFEYHFCHDCFNAIGEFANTEPRPTQEIPMSKEDARNLLDNAIKLSIALQEYPFALLSDNAIGVFTKIKVRPVYYMRKDVYKKFIAEMSSDLRYASPLTEEQLRKPRTTMLCNIPVVPVEATRRDAPIVAIAFEPTEKPYV